MAINTSKFRHFVNDAGNVTVRKPFDPLTDGRYNADKHFLPHENSPFLDYVLKGERYLQFTGHAFGQDELEAVTAWFSNFANHGARTRTGENNSVEFWRFLYGTYSDKGQMIHIPSTSETKSLDDLGVHVIDPDKAAKYLKRVFAPYQYASFGRVLSFDLVDDGSVVEFELENGFRGLHRNIELDKMESDVHRAVADGQNRIAPEFLEALGVKDRNLNTYGCKPTGFDQIGVTKGYGHAQPGLKFSFVSYGTKKQVVYDDFFFGILGSLKPGNSFMSDIQSMTNFDEFVFALPAAQHLFDEIQEAIGDKDKLRGMFLSRLRNVSKSINDEPSATENYSLINALESGVDIETVPGLFRRVYNHFMTEILNCEKGRIPFDQYGLRCDAMPDPHMFDDYGDVHPENTIIPIGHVVIPDAPIGPIVAYRQPNGMSEERSESMNVHIRQFDKYEGRRRAIYGRDLVEILAPMNGADMDDTLCIIHDPKMVKHVRGLKYPVTFKMEVIEKPKITLGRYYDAITRTVENLSTASYTPKDMDRAMERARTMTMKLGQVVLAIMLDTLLSGPHKVNMMEFISQQIENEQDKDRKIFYLEMREWLSDRPDYQLNDVATNLEAVIDFCVQGRGDSRQFDPWMRLVNEIKNNAKVYPFIFAKQGTGFMGQGRISQRRQLGVDYILAPSLLDVALTEVEQERKMFLNDLRAHEWNCITPVPMELEYEFGSAPDITQKARDIQKWFNPMAVAAMSIPGDSKMKRQAYNDVLYGQFHKCNNSGEVKERCTPDCKLKGKLLAEGLLQIMDGYDREDRLLIAVEMHRLVYRNKTMKINEETGDVRSVADGVFCNNIIFNYYLEALDRCNLTGKYLQIELDQVALSQNIRNQIFEVEVVDGNVLRKKDSFWLGTVDADNGEYRAVNGMLEIRAPHISITSEWMNEDIINEDGSMPKASELID